ncbi:hypothetical protein A0H81_02896 [Grifola frondosa]|uniref:Uncharacterized protein n=1 Tax=Grifola frondosa TaxID=5627 RepID=A0A1C7MRR7_GRIFR|nr:hypothetical protein A0H81_02896 [Grifola frondosa]
MDLPPLPPTSLSTSRTPLANSTMQQSNTRPQEPRISINAAPLIPKDADLPPLPTALATPSHTAAAKNLARAQLSYRQHPRFCYSDHFQTEAQSGLAHAADAKSACPSAHELRLTRAATSCIARSGAYSAVPHPYKDAHGYRVPLSEQEAELDRRFTVVVEDQHSDSEQESESKRIMEAWLTRNREAQIASPAPAADEDVGKVCELKEQLGKDVTVSQSTSPSRATFGRHTVPLHVDENVRTARMSSSMSNLRCTITGTFSSMRPKSTVEASGADSRRARNSRAYRSRRHRITSLCSPASAPRSEPHDGSGLA